MVSHPKSVHGSQSLHLISIYILQSAGLLHSYRVTQVAGLLAHSRLQAEESAENALQFHRPRIRGCLHGCRRAARREHIEQCLVFSTVSCHSYLDLLVTASLESNAKRNRERRGMFSGLLGGGSGGSQTTTPTGGGGTADGLTSGTGTSGTGTSSNQVSTTPTDPDQQYTKDGDKCGFLKNLIYKFIPFKSCKKMSET